MQRITITILFTCSQLMATSDKNDSIVNYVEQHGSQLAPSYSEVVCTDFVIKVLKHFTGVDKKMYSKVQIITPEPFKKLMKNKSEVPNGVCYALNSSGKGRYIPMEQAKRGDFVQFWNSFIGFNYSGHCGILDHIDYENKMIYMYSSHPQTDGFGLHVFDWPDYVVFARLY